MHGLGLPRLPSKPLSWDKPRATGTLESIVNQATCTLPQFSKPPFDNTITAAPGGGGNEILTWFDHHRTVATSAAAPSNTMTMDALVPCGNNHSDEPNSGHMIDTAVSMPGVLDTSAKGVVNGCSTRVGSCSAAATQDEDTRLPGKRKGNVASVPATPDWSSRSPSVSGSTFGMDSQHVILDTKESDHDSVCHSRPQANSLN